MNNRTTVFCHRHAYPLPRYPRFTRCPHCLEEAPYETRVVESVVNYFSPILYRFSIQTEVEIQMGADKRRADVILVDGNGTSAAIVECKAAGTHQADGIPQLKSYLCATDTPLGIFANSEVPDAWEFFENLGQNRFKAITIADFWRHIQSPPEIRTSQPSREDENRSDNTEKAIGMKPDAPLPDNHSHEFERAGSAQITAAIADSNQLIRLNPDYAKTQYRTQAIDDSEATQLNPDYAKTYYQRGHAKAALGQYVAAISDYDRAIHLSRNYAVAYTNRGVAKAALGQHTAAIADYDRAILLKADDALAYNNRGLAKAALGQYVAALADYDKAIHLNPDDPFIYNNRGVAKVALGRYTSALADYDRAIHLNPDNPLFYANRAAVKTSLDQPIAAKADYDKAIHLKSLEKVLP